MDENGNRKLECDDFRWGLMDYGVSVSKEEAAEILAHFDKNGDGRVDFDEFLVTLRVSYNTLIYILLTQLFCFIGRPQSNKN